MFRRHALGGASVIVMELMLLPSSAVFAQDKELPAVTVDAPRPASQRAVRKPAQPRLQASAGRRPAQPAVAASNAGASSRGEPETASAARARLDQAPSGQTATTIDRSRFEDRPVFSVNDILRDSPGVSFKQGNGPRDMTLSIRGSGARVGGAMRNIVLLEDGFTMTQPDGFSRTDSTDPHAYAGVDVYRGPSSALFGNWANGGAINFRTRTGAEIDGRRGDRPRGRQLRLSHQLHRHRQEIR
jgi:iron complex outermembrane receptor protein